MFGLIAIDLQSSSFTDVEHIAAKSDIAAFWTFWTTAGCHVRDNHTAKDLVENKKALPMKVTNINN